MEPMKPPPAPAALCLLFSIAVCCLLSPSHAQQAYENNKQDDCYGTNGSTTLGYSCNGAHTSCTSYLTFRSETSYQSAALISYLLSTDASNITKSNSGLTSSDISLIPIGQMVIVPTPCSCSGNYYQHNSSYTIKSIGETYLVIANDTYQSLSTCQALIAQNPQFDSRNLTAGQQLRVPLRCACPTKNQTTTGVKYLLTYLITWGDTVDSISQRFNVDAQSVYDANGLSTSAIYPFTTLLIPLKTEPTGAEVATPSAAPQPAIVPPASGDDSGGSSKKWVFVGIGIGAGFLVLICLLLGWYLCCWRPRRRLLPPQGKPKMEAGEYGTLAGKMTPSSAFFSSEVGSVLGSLTIYKFEELEKATGFFGEDHRIRGSVYRGVINGDDAAVKRLKGDVSSEINILKQINHSNVIRLSGFCLHQGNTYLVYEFAEKGSLSDWLHHKKDSSDSVLSWSQRVQIAYNVADGLNYLHHYTNPPYVHKNLKSSNILLDGEFRGKVANFGLARPVEDWEAGPQLTRHVVGTQGYMAPEYLEHGLITPKLDVFAFGVVMLELLSGKEATSAKEGEEKGDLLLWASIGGILSGEDVRTKLRGFVDPCLRNDYPFDLAFAMAELATRCVASEAASRPAMTEVLMSLSAIYTSTLDWDPSDVGNDNGSLVHAR